ncbi:MAG: hypothetical protein QOH90_754, partial [Actinomycetota bacterium]|nr:hypothetical protein [Actinomycetota bacterium]
MNRRSISLCFALAAFAASGIANPASAAGRWRPRAGVTFQWQLQGKVDTSVAARVYDIDMFDSS